MGFEKITAAGFNDFLPSLLDQFGINDFEPEISIGETDQDIPTDIISVVNQFIEDFPDRILDDSHVRRILKSTKNSAGVNAFNRVSARLASKSTGISEDHIIEFIKDGSEPAPQEVITALSEAGKVLSAIDFSSSSKLLAYHEAVKSLGRFRREADSLYSIDSGMNFLRAKFYLENFAQTGTVGNIEGAIIDAMVYEEPINFTLVKCPPKITEVRGHKRRLYIPTSIAAEDIPVSELLLGMQSELGRLSVRSTAMFIIPDQNFRLEFPRGSGIVPDHEIDLTVTNLNMYAHNLGLYFSGTGLIVSTMSQIVSGSEYERIKERIVLDTLPNYSPYSELVGKDIPKQKNVYVPQGIFEQAVGYRREAWKKLYEMDDYPREVASYSIAQMLGDLHGISVVYDHIPNNIFITNHRRVRQNYLGKRIDTKDQPRKILFRDEFH